MPALRELPAAPSSDTQPVLGERLSGYIFRRGRNLLLSDMEYETQSNFDDPVSLALQWALGAVEGGSPLYAELVECLNSWNRSAEVSDIWSSPDALPYPVPTRNAPSPDTFHQHRRLVLENMFNGGRRMDRLPSCPFCEGHCVEDGRYYDPDPVDSLLDATDDLIRRMDAGLS